MEKTHTVIRHAQRARENTFMLLRKKSLTVLLAVLMAIAPAVALAVANTGPRNETEAREYNKRQQEQRANEAAAQLVFLTDAITRDPEDPLAYYQRGRFYSEYAHRDEKLALVDFDAAIRLKPDFAKAYSRRAAIRAALKDYEGSADDLNAALKLDSKASDIRSRLATLCYASPDESVRDLIKARQLLEEIVDDSDGADRGHMSLLAGVCAELGDFENAVKWETQRLTDAPAGVSASRKNLETYQRGEFVSELRTQMSLRLALDPAN